MDGLRERSANRRVCQCFLLWLECRLRRFERLGQAIVGLDMAFKNLIGRGAFEHRCDRIVE